MRVRVGGSRKRDPLLYREFNDSIAWVKFVHWLAPSSGRKLDREIPRANEIQCFVDEGIDFYTWPMTMDFDEIEMGQAIN